MAAKRERESEAQGPATKVPKSESGECHYCNNSACALHYCGTQRCATRICPACLADGNGWGKHRTTLYCEECYTLLLQVGCGLVNFRRELQHMSCQELFSFMVRTRLGRRRSPKDLLAILVRNIETAEPTTREAEAVYMVQAMQLFDCFDASLRLTSRLKKMSAPNAARMPRFCAFLARFE